MNDVRIEFNLKLARVYQAATHERAVNDCRALMEQYAENKQFLRIAISVLTDKSLVIGSSGVFSKALHAALFGYLSKQFKKSMQDPLDKPASRIKTYERIYQFMSTTFFVEPSQEIAQGCAISMKEIINFTFPELLDAENFDKLITIFFEPLFAILRGTGQNKNAVASASFCLRFLVQNLIMNHSELITSSFAAKFTNLAIKRQII